MLTFSTVTLLFLQLEPCLHCPSQLLTNTTSNPSTSTRSKMSASGSSVMTSTVSAPSLSAIGMLFLEYNLLHMQRRRLTSSPFCSEEIFTVPVCSALAAILEKAEEELARKCHPGPYICAFSENFLSHLTSNLYPSLHFLLVHSSVETFFSVIHICLPLHLHVLPSIRDSADQFVYLDPWSCKVRVTG
jgi:hypothetical protein